MHLRDSAHLRFTFCSPSILQNSLKVFQHFSLLVKYFFSSFVSACFMISSSVLEANLSFGVCAVVCAIVWLTSSQI